MSLPFATEAFRLSNVIKKELWPDDAWCRLVVTVSEAAAKAYVPGTVLGKVTATGKYKIALETAADGSKVVDAIVIGEQAIAASTDTKVLVLFKGPAVVSKFGLILDATYDNDTKKNVAYASLEAKGIQVNDAV
jgi:hypothetical protein